MKRLVHWLICMLCAANAAAAETAPAAPEAQPRLVTYAQSLDRLREQASSGVEALIRSDGYIYAVDVGQAMTELAVAGEREAYASLRALAVRSFVQVDPQNPYINGFVAWRIRPGNPPDASGTAEALRIAEGLLAGAEAFGSREDARLAHQVLLGYARHAYRDRGNWLIRNYFNFGTRAFAANSYIVNYDLDLVSRWKTPEGEELAANMRALLLKAARPNGLLNELIQPEVATAIPLPELVTFSPNGVHSIANSCTALERATGELAQLGRAFLDTVVRAIASLGPIPAAEFLVPAYLDGRTGMPISRDYPGDTYVQGCLARLSHRLGHPHAPAFRLSYLMQMDAKWGDGRQYDLFKLSEIARTLRTIAPR